MAKVRCCWCSFPGTTSQTKIPGPDSHWKLQEAPVVPVLHTKPDISVNCSLTLKPYYLQCAEFKSSTHSGPGAISPACSVHFQLLILFGLLRQCHAVLPLLPLAWSSLQSGLPLSSQQWFCFSKPPKHWNYRCALPHHTQTKKIKYANHLAMLKQCQQGY